MTENKNTEIAVEQTNEGVTDVKKEGIVKKTGKFIKNHWREGVALIVGVIVGGAAYAHASSKSGGDEFEVCNPIEAEFSVEDEEDAE